VGQAQQDIVVLLSTGLNMNDEQLIEFYNNNKNLFFTIGIELGQNSKSSFFTLEDFKNLIQLIKNGTIS
jgi:hypothetical protein